MTLTLVSVNPVSPHPANVTLTDAIGLTYTKVRNGIGECTFAVPVTSPNLIHLEPWKDEVVIRYTNSTSAPGLNDIVWWGVVVDRSVGDGFVEVRAYDLKIYLTKRFVGDHDRTDQITNGAFTVGALGASPPSGWTEAGSDLNAYNANTVTPLLLPHYCEVVHTTRVVDTRGNGEPVDNPDDPDDYHGPDESLQQNGLSTPDGGVMIVRGYSFIREDATFAYGGKGFDRRGLYAEVLNSSGQVLRTYTSPLDDNTPRNEWVRHELEARCDPGGSVNFRLYGIGGGAGGKASAVGWDAVGAFFMESLSFADGSDAVDIIEGLLAHAQDSSFGKSSLGMDGDAANTSSGVVFPVVAYQHDEHRMIWDAMLDYCAPRAEASVEIRTSWSAFGADRHLRVVATPTTGNGVSMTMGTNVTRVDYHESGAEVANRILAVGPGSGPDREESEWDDTAALNLLVLEDVVSVPDDLPIGWYERYARGAVAKRKDTVKTLRVAAVDAEAASGTSWFDTEPGELVSFTGSYGPYAYSNQLLRVLSVTHEASVGRFVFELSEEP